MHSSPALSRPPHPWLPLPRRLFSSCPTRLLLPKPGLTSGTFYFQIPPVLSFPIPLVILSSVFNTLAPQLWCSLVIPVSSEPWELPMSSRPGRRASRRGTQAWVLCGSLEQPAPALQKPTDTDREEAASLVNALKDVRRGREGLRRGTDRGGLKK